MDEQQPTPLADIGAAGSPATPDALRSIVARHQRARTRTLGILLAVALVAGPIAGWAVGHAGGGGQQVATGSSPNTPNAGAPSAVNAPVGGSSTAEGFASAGTNPPKATHLFTRTTSDGITIRAYRMDPPAPPPSTSIPPKAQQQTICPRPMTVKPGAPAGAESGAVSSGSGSATASASAASGEAGTSTGGEPAPVPPPSVVEGAPPLPCAPEVPPICKTGPSVLAEVSNDAAVGQSFDPIDEKQPSDALSHLVVSPFGVPESSPATFVTVQTGPGVATVRLRVPSGATDEMAPSGGVAVLAVGGSRSDGTVVEALDSDGKVLQSLPIEQNGPKAAFACAVAAGPATARVVPVPAGRTPPTTR